MYFAVVSMAKNQAIAIKTVQYQWLNLSYYTYDCITYP